MLLYPLLLAVGRAGRGAVEQRAAPFGARLTDLAPHHPLAHVFEHAAGEMLGAEAQVAGQVLWWLWHLGCMTGVPLRRMHSQIVSQHPPP